MPILAPLILAAALAASPGDGVAGTSVHGNQLFVRLNVDATYEATVILTFEDIGVLLDATLLDIYAISINPADASVRNRLPAETFIPERFPVLINIQKDPLAVLSFNGGYEIEVITRHLDFGTSTPFRLLKAPNSGAFTDISSTAGFGSYRVRGRGGEFSDFVIAADLRPPGKVADAKFTEVQDLIDTGFSDGDISLLGTKTTLSNQLTTALNSYDNGNTNQAVTNVETLLDTIKNEAGNTIDDTYNGLLDTHSYAGTLTGAVESLRFAVELQGQRRPESADILKFPLTTGMGHELVLFVAFDGAQALELNNFTVDAMDVDPDDPALLARLPTGGVQVRVPDEFPVLIQVDPGNAAEQAFRGEVRFEVRTKELSLVGDTVLRLFKAKSGVDPFVDVSDTYGFGSYRVRGRGGEFSELMIVEDVRPVADVINAKLVQLRDVLEGNEGDIDAGVYATLLGRLDAAEAAANGADYATAEAQIRLFIDTAEDESGTNIPAIWHITDTPGGTRANIAALLLAAARTLEFSLEIQQAPTYDPADVDHNGVVDEDDVFYVINQVYPGSGGLN